MQQLALECPQKQRIEGKDEKSSYKLDINLTNEVFRIG